MKRATKDSHFPKYSQSDWTVAKIIFTSSILASCSAFPCSLYLFVRKISRKKGDEMKFVARSDNNDRQTFTFFFFSPIRRVDWWHLHAHAPPEVAIKCNQIGNRISNQRFRPRILLYTRGMISLLPPPPLPPSQSRANIFVCISRSSRFSK